MKLIKKNKVVITAILLFVPRGNLCVHACVRDNWVGATLWITHLLQPFAIDLLSWFQQMAKMVTLSKRPIVVTLSFL